MRVYGIGQRDWSSVLSQEEVDLVALVNGGVCVGYSDAHFGHPRNMIGTGFIRLFVFKENTLTCFFLLFFLLLLLIHLLTKVKKKLYKTRRQFCSLV